MIKACVVKKTISFFCLFLPGGLVISQVSVYPDTILFNGKIITVDDFFSVKEAIAIQGTRIVAVGTNEDIQSLSGPDTLVSDLRGKTVIPGLIDNHNHVIRATEYWPNEARLDGVSSRIEALTILETKANELADNEWLMSLGGWTENQFIGNQADFTLEELDEVASDRPAFIQSTYDHAFGNTRWFEEMDIPIVAGFEQHRDATGLSSYVVRDETGLATGRLNGGMPMVVSAIERFPVVTAERQELAIKEAFTHLNSIGLTSVYDPAGAGIKGDSYLRIKSLSEETGLTVRIFYTLSPLSFERRTTPNAVEEIIEEIRTSRPFQGNEEVDMIAIGESYYSPFHRDSLFMPTNPSEEDFQAGKNILSVAAQGGWSVQTHSSRPETIDILLDAIEEVNQQYPLRQLRWSITHADMVGRSQIDRMRHLGMNLQMRSISVLFQPRRGVLIQQMGEAGYHVPPLRMIQESGIPWGLGTDGTKAAQINPFVTLWWAVTGLALNGELVLSETLSREEALIAHTRSNAYLMFQEANIGSIRPGFLADLVVLDRDYLTISATEIKDIQADATFVGGKLVWGSL